MTSTTQTFDCRALATASDVAVLSVQYRLTPDYPFPAGLDDVYAVVTAVPNGSPGLEVADRCFLAIGGDAPGPIRPPVRR